MASVMNNAQAPKTSTKIDPLKARNRPPDSYVATLATRHLTTSFSSMANNTATCSHQREEEGEKKEDIDHEHRRASQFSSSASNLASLVLHKQRVNKSECDSLIKTGDSTTMTTIITKEAKEKKQSKVRVIAKLASPSICKQQHQQTNTKTKGSQNTKNFSSKIGTTTAKQILSIMSVALISLILLGLIEISIVNCMNSFEAHEQTRWLHNSQGHRKLFKRHNTNQLPEPCNSQLSRLKRDAVEILDRSKHHQHQHQQQLQLQLQELRAKLPNCLGLTNFYNSLRSTHPSLAAYLLLLASNPARARPSSSGQPADVTGSIALASSQDSNVAGLLERAERILGQHHRLSSKVSPAWLSRVLADPQFAKLVKWYHNHHLDTTNNNLSASPGQPTTPPPHSSEDSARNPAMATRQYTQPSVYGRVVTRPPTGSSGPSIEDINDKIRIIQGKPPIERKPPGPPIYGTVLTRPPPGSPGRYSLKPTRTPGEADGRVITRPPYAGLQLNSPAVMQSSSAAEGEEAFASGDAELDTGAETDTFDAGESEFPIQTLSQARLKQRLDQNANLMAAEARGLRQSTLTNMGHSFEGRWLSEPVPEPSAELLD